MSVADKLKTIQTIKSDIKTSIINKGIEVGDDFTTYASAIDTIEANGPTIELKDITITENGVYTADEGEGYNNITVNVPDLNGSYEEGFTAGKQNQKELLENITITENGTYEKEDGYKKVVVNVEDNGYDFITELNYSEEDNERLNSILNQFVEDGIVLSKPDSPDYDKKKVVFATSDVTDFFHNDKLVYVPGDVLKLENSTRIFEGCKELVRIPTIDCEKLDSMTDAFYGCHKLKEINLINTNNLIQANCFFETYNLETINRFDCGKVDEFLTFNDSYNLKNVGGFVDFGKAFTREWKLDMQGAYKLSFYSAYDIADCIYDISGKGLECSVIFSDGVMWSKDFDGEYNPRKEQGYRETIAASLTYKGWIVTFS